MIFNFEKQLLHRYYDMVLTPIILCNDGCCISCFVNIQVVKLLKMHKINFYQQNDMESYDKFKNPYYKVGMNTLDLLKLTFEKHNNIVMKLTYPNFGYRYPKFVE